MLQNRCSAGAFGCKVGGSRLRWTVGDHTGVLWQVPHRNLPRDDNNGLAPLNSGKNEVSDKGASQSDRMEFLEPASLVSERGAVIWN